MPETEKRVFSWSGGKDSALALHEIQMSAFGVAVSAEPRGDQRCNGGTSSRNAAVASLPG
jgi:hypothetical protein